MQVFVVLTGGDRGEQVVLGDNHQQITIGSAPGADLVLSDRTVSRRHCTVSLEAGQVVVRDPTRRTAASRTARASKIVIGHGAEVTLGKTVLKFVPREEALEPEECSEGSFGELIGHDPKMRRLFGLLRDIAQSDTTVLIEGETGTGKELIAEEIHRHSRRANGPFVVFDCGAVPRELIESTLFGHVRRLHGRNRRSPWSVCGSARRHDLPRRDRRAGTRSAAGVLRALDKRAVRRVGANSYEQVDVRVIAATNRDLPRRGRAACLPRRLWFYRLAVIRALPALRERVATSMCSLTTSFVSFRDPQGVDSADRAAASAQLWLAGQCPRAAQRHRTSLRPSSGRLAAHRRRAGRSAAARRTGRLPHQPALQRSRGQLVEQFEREYIIDLMKRHRMNLSAAAREAQIDRKHLRELLRKYGLDSRGDYQDQLRTALPAAVPRCCLVGAHVPLGSPMARAGLALAGRGPCCSVRPGRVGQGFTTACVDRTSATTRPP